MTQIQTVTGCVEHTALGIVLPHEHLANSLGPAFSPAEDEIVRGLLDGPVSPDLAWVLRDYPYNSQDNVGLDDEAAVLQDLQLFGRMGGGTVIDLTPPGLGRNPGLLKSYSERSGVNVIMGSGYYLQNFQSPDDLDASEAHQTEMMIADFNRDGVRPGVLGEIGVSPDFTLNEEKSLRAAAHAQRTLGVPLFIHMPGWQRLGQRILDIVLDECGVDPKAVVLCHMDPSFVDPGYQRELAQRGTYLCFDMIGMPYRFPGEGESPAPAQVADAICALIAGGHQDRLLLSHDTFLKGMLTRYGGNGFGYVPFVFPSRLTDRGLGREQVSSMLIANPAQLFHQASNTN